jgi:hypothetical protein
MTPASCSPPNASFWPGSAIALVGFGVVVERFGLVLRMVSNQPLSASQRGFSLGLGVTLLLLGAGVPVVTALQFRAVVRGLGEKEIPRGYSTTGPLDHWTTGPTLACGSTSCPPSWRSHWHCFVSGT